jgi:hypothetical protein
MSRKRLEIGELVIVLRDEWAGTVGVVSRPISQQTMGHVLVQKEGSIVGVDASLGEVEAAGESSGGFAQLGYQLIKLGSHVIEQKLILYRT